MAIATAMLLAFALAIPSYSVTQDTVSWSRVITAAKDVMQAARFATFVTTGSDGHPQARVVDPFAPDSDMVVWIATNPLTRKVAEIRRDPRVTLLYFNTAALEFVTLQGIANLVSDSAESRGAGSPSGRRSTRRAPGEKVTCWCGFVRRNSR